MLGRFASGIVSAHCRIAMHSHSMPQRRDDTLQNGASLCTMYKYKDVTNGIFHSFPCGPTLSKVLHNVSLPFTIKAM